jgi:hypothetical protein
MRVKFVLLLVAIFSISTYGGVSDDFDAEALRDGFSRTPLCGTQESAAACLLMPWPASVGEGVIIVGQKAYIFLRKDKKNKEFSDLISQLPIEKQDEYAAILALVMNDSKNNLGVVGVGTVFVCWVNVTNGEITFHSISQFQLRDMMFFNAKKGVEFLSELRASKGVWSPPADYFPKYEFSYVD